jgi:hypothetical protein
MTPELSRRIAYALHHLPAGAISRHDRARLVSLSQRCDRFEQLPDWIQSLVLQGEQAARK